MSMTDKELIMAHGGPARLAEKLGFGRGGVQRVANWMRRGIPSRVKLDYAQILGELTLPKPRPLAPSQGAPLQNEESTNAAPMSAARPSAVTATDAARDGVANG